jgi:hypothetical protein
VDGIDTAGIHMVEDTMMEVERVEREHRGMVLVKHRIDELIERGSFEHGVWRGIEEVTPSLHVESPIDHGIGESCLDGRGGGCE